MLFGGWDFPQCFNDVSIIDLGKLEFSVYFTNNKICRLKKTGIRDLKDKLGSSHGINSTMKDLEYGDAGYWGDLISR